MDLARKEELSSESEYTGSWDNVIWTKEGKGYSDDEDGE